MGLTFYKMLILYKDIIVYHCNNDLYKIIYIYGVAAT